MKRKILVYLHGFNSSKKSDKALLVQNYYSSKDEVTVICEDLPPFATPLVELIKAKLQEVGYEKSQCQLGFVASSLGAYMATYLVENEYPQARAVLINPAVDPYNHFGHFVGENQNPYTGLVFFLEDKHRVELEEYNTDSLQNPQNYKVFIQKGDETLDYRKGETKYKKTSLLMEEGGSHAFDGFSEHLDEINAFLFSNT